MERNGLVAFTLYHGTVLERPERLFLASGNEIFVTKHSQYGIVQFIFLVEALLFFW